MSDEGQTRKRKKGKPIKVADRSFRRLEERSGPTAPLPTAWATGLFLGAVGGLGVGAWDVAVLQQAGLAVLPSLEPQDLVPRLVAHAALGGAFGLLAGATGLWGQGWSIASVFVWGSWLLGAVVADAAAASGAPAIVGLVGTLTVGTVLGQIAGRLPIPTWLAAGAVTLVSCAAVLLLPLEVHLLPSAFERGGVAVALAVLVVVSPLAPLAAVVARDGRPPVLGVFALLSTGVGAIVATSGKPAPTWVPAKDGPLVVVVAVDGLRPDRMGEWTPNLRRLAARSVVFSEARATSNWSVPSIGSMFTGRWPYDHGAGLNDGTGPRHSALRADAVTLASRLSDSGWATGAVVADPRLRTYALDTGFQVWADDPEGGFAPSAAAPLRPLHLPLADWSPRSAAPRVTDRALTAMAADPGRARLLFVQYADLAGPYLSTPEDRAAVGATTRPWPEDEWEAALRSLDRELGRLIDGLPADAWLVLAGTRGMVLSEQRDPGVSASDARFGTTLFDEQARVALMFAGPGVQPRISDQLVSLVDVAPTLLRAVQGPHTPGEPQVTLRDPVGFPLAPVFGAEPTPEELARPVLAQSSLIGKERQALWLGANKLVHNGRNTVLYDLSVDPHETTGLQLDGEHQALARQLDTHLPSDGSGVTLTAPPALVLQLGQLLSPLSGERR